MRLRSVAAVMVALLLGACSSGAAADGSKGRLTVFGAASLTEAFTDIGAAFENDNPGVDVSLSFAGTPDLVAQIEQGAGAAVLASADEANMERIVAGDLTETEPQVFATNRLAIVVEPGNPKGIGGLADLAADDLIVALAAPEVPAGRYAAQMLDEARVRIEADSLEVDVKAVLTRVSLGEADAGIVYATDVVAAGEDVLGIEIPADQNVIARYPIAVLAGGSETAQAFVDFVLSAEGQGLLEASGFGPP